MFNLKLEFFLYPEKAQMIFISNSKGVKWKSFKLQLIFRVAIGKTRTNINLPD